jgi:hypothetical protein
MSVSPYKMSPLRLEHYQTPPNVRDDIISRIATELGFFLGYFYQFIDRNFDYRVFLKG